MSATRPQTTNLFLLEDLDNDTRTAGLAERDIDALRTVASWITTFVAKPNEDLGRPGPVCPFVPGALERNALWLAPEQIGGRSLPEVVQLIDGYKSLLLSSQPVDGDEAIYKVIVVVFIDLAVERAKDFLDDVAAQLGGPSYVEDGAVFGEFYPGNEGTALYNPSFRPFRSPVPFLFIRLGVISDWKFFLDDDDWLKRWADRYGASGALALAQELRPLPWRSSDAQRAVSR
jgi:hypothetical protein